MYRLKADYFNWLCEKVHIDMGTVSYMLMAKELFHRYFESIVPNDDNRASDGRELREEFLSEVGHLEALPYLDNAPCSIFEMLIALARRMEFELCSAESSQDRTTTYFWELIGNLGLMALSDDVYAMNPGGWNADLKLCVNRLVHRTYNRNGHGGLFPLKHPMEDQRKVEIWYQMQSYLEENYD